MVLKTKCDFVSAGELVESACSLVPTPGVLVCLSWGWTQESSLLTSTLRDSDISGVSAYKLSKIMVDTEIRNLNSSQTTWIEKTLVSSSDLHHPQISPSSMFWQVPDKHLEQERVNSGVFKDGFDLLSTRFISRDTDILMMFSSMPRTFWKLWTIFRLLSMHGQGGNWKWQIKVLENRNQIKQQSWHFSWE